MSTVPTVPKKIEGGKKRREYKAKNGKVYAQASGSKREVWNGKAHHTSGGLKRSDLKKNAAGRIVSKKASEAAEKRVKALAKWRKHLNKYRKKHPKLSLKEAMKGASKSYKSRAKKSRGKK